MTAAASNYRPNCSGSRAPSAEVQGHDPQRKTIVAGKRHVGIAGVEPVGTYAIRIRFDDGHDTGLYSWDWLYTLGEDQQRIWRTYLDALADRRLSREPAPGRTSA